MAANVVVAFSEGSARVQLRGNAVQAKQKTILVVEDDPDISRLLCLVFLGASQDFDCQVIPAMDGLEGLRMARELRPDLITLDLALPDMSGREVLQQLRQEEALAEIPVIVLSVWPYDPAPEEPVAAVIVKTLGVAQLEKAARRVLGGSTAKKRPSH
jgi:CheY-like chemotaxis protein